VRVALLSDIHANSVALEAVLLDAERSGAGSYLVLGDLVDLGPDPGGVVERVRALGCPVVGGNHDPLDEQSAVPALEASRIWSRQMLSSEQRTWLDALPDERSLDVDGNIIWAVHASPVSRTHAILASTRDDEIAQWFERHPCAVLCCGHSHVQLMRRIGAQTIVNAGSVGMPFSAPYSGGAPTIFTWAEYALLDVGEQGLSVELKRVRYDFERFERAFLDSGFDQAGALLDAWAR
jgi:predicted phosphodiesterase